jgi:LmbE family N-acetylglucosaminyl deacetylase
MTPPESLKLLVIVAHPHDVTHMLGTCGNHIERGDQVTVVSVTDGARTHSGDTAAGDAGGADFLKNLAAQKKQEFVGACGLFGITDVRMLPFADKPIRATEELIGALADVVYEIRPHIVLTENGKSEGDVAGSMGAFGEDHATVRAAVNQVLGFVVGLPDARTGRAPHHVVEVFQYGMGLPTSDIDLYVDVTRQITKRVQAEAMYKSQGHTPQWARKRIEVELSHYGRVVGVPYAEPFIRRHTMVEDHLIVSDHYWRLAQMTAQQRMDLISQPLPEE